MAAASSSSYDPANLSMSLGGTTDMSLAREEALHKFKQINWNSYTRSGAFSLSKEDIQNLQMIDKIMSNPTFDQLEIDEFFQKNGTSVCIELMKIIQNIMDPIVLRYALARTEELLPDGYKFQKRLSYFVPPGGNFDAGTLLRLIGTGHAYTEHAAGNLLAKFLAAYPNDKDITAAIDWSLKMLDLSMPDSNDPQRASSVRSAIGMLAVLLRNSRAVNIFARRNGILVLSIFLKNCHGKAQLAYECCFTFWILSFNDEAVSCFGSGAVEAIAQHVVAAPREKVIRVALLALHNLVGKCDNRYTEQMIDVGLLKTLSRLRERKWADEDILEDCETLRDILVRNYKELTTIERYEKELRDKKLNWGVLHTDQFWKENIMEFEKRDFGNIRQLISLLEDSDDTTTITVALNDLGSFVCYYPNGRMIIKKLNGKNIVMKLMTTNENAEIQKYALSCISKIMLNKWEYVK